MWCRTRGIACRGIRLKPKRGWLYDDATDGVDDSPIGEMLGIAPMGLAGWFKPFNNGRYVHPYAKGTPTGEDEQESGEHERS
ncbi:hypothetical protein OG698_10350 [Streptomyces sp. NBC_01003]|uniref:hypothetical protein n=1 Tax=Streptomyces sp. NBC_01003 TaxID=2903714 RepID=UPI003863F962|nr:hypothetical protein OG698_10350 [Streptomyces sp. NBC_01003]